MSAPMTAETRGAKAQNDVTALLRSRHTLLWITTLEEARVEPAIGIAAAAAAARNGAGYRTVLWDCEQGLTNLDGSPIERTQDPAQALDWLTKTSGRVALVMRDLHSWVRDPSLLRVLRNAQRRMQALPPSSARAVIVLSPSGEIPPDLRGCTTIIDWPLPDRAEVAAIIADTLGALAEGQPAKDLAGEAFEAAVDAAVGLSASEAENCLSLSLVKHKKIDPASVAQEKRRIIARIPGLAWYDPDPRGLEAVGGLDQLKGWLGERRSAFSAKARAYGLPAPKGCLLVGIPGTGKSLTAKAVAAAWQVPLIRWDVGAMRSKFVGDSEANVRRVIQTVESLGACVLWLDEVEKALAGGTGPQGDGGVAADALGTILSWMQERLCPVFVVATANDVRSLPPELLRKGRFDEVWWIDLPTQAERVDILRTALTQFGRMLKNDEMIDISEATEGFVGAELAAIVPDAMYRAFADGERALEVDDVLEVARRCVPLSKTAANRIEELRAWAKGRARPASTNQDSTSNGARAIVIDQ